jgi:hypothetical protein
LLTSATAFVLVGTAAAHARILAGGMPWESGTATPPVPVRPGPWMFFTSDEASLIEAAVDRLIPPDERGPGGKDAGCAVFIDRQLAGPYGRAAGLYMQPPFMPGAATQGYQMPDAPAVRYRTGLKALADYVKAAFSGRSFSELAPRDQDKVLDPVLLRPDIRKPSPEASSMGPMHRRASTIQEAGLSENKRAAADGGCPPRRFGGFLHESDHGCIGGRHIHLGDRTHDDGVEGGISERLGFQRHASGRPNRTAMF